MKCEAGQTIWIEDLVKEAQEAADVNNLRKSTKSPENYRRRKSVTQNPCATNKDVFLFQKHSNCRDGKNIIKKDFKRMQ